MKIMHVSPIESHPVFSSLLEEQAKSDDVVFVKLEFSGVAYDKVDKKEYNILEENEWVFVKNVNRVYDQDYDDRLNKAFNVIFRKYQPDIVHIQNFSGFSLLAILKASSSFHVDNVVTLHEHSLFCIRGVCNNKRKNCNIDSVSECACDDLLKKASLSSLSPEEYNKKRLKNIKEIIKYSDKIICPSIQQRNMLVKLFGDNDKFRVVYYGLDLVDGNHKPVIRKSLLGKRKKTFGYLGTASWIKGIDSIICAMDILKEKQIDDDFEFIFGLATGFLPEEESKLLKNIKDYSNVDVIENVKRKDLFNDFFSKIDYLVIPSIWNETGPLTLFESLYYNVPVIISDNESMKEKIMGCEGCKVFKDTNDLAGIMIEIVSEGKGPKQDDSEQVDFSVKVKSMDKYAHEIKSIYKSLLSQKDKGLFLRIGTKCNNNCNFCVTGENNPKEFIDFESIKQTMQGGRGKYDSIVLTGGEPTIRQDFFKMLDLARELDYSVLLQTNGRMFYYKDFCEKIKNSGLDISMSINVNSYKPEVHDAMTMAGGSFIQTTNGIKNLIIHGYDVLGKIMLTKLNYNHISETIDFMIGLGIKEIWLVFLTPFGSARKNFEKIMPSYTEVMPYVNSALSKHSGDDIKIGLEGFPYCCINEDFISFVTEENDLFNLDGIYPMEGVSDYNCKAERVYSQKQKLESCNGCMFENICEGVYKEYVKRKGDREFIPIIDKVNYKENHETKKDNPNKGEENAIA